MLSQKLKGVKRYPLVLMLEPLWRPGLRGLWEDPVSDHILDKQLTPEQCWAAAEECGAPMVASGREPLIHPEIAKIVQDLVESEEVHLSLYERDLLEMMQAVQVY